MKNWPQYEALREKGYSKESSARITNASAKKRRKKRKRPARGTLQAAVSKRY